MDGLTRHRGLSEAVERLSAGLAIGRAPVRLRRVEEEPGPLPSAQVHEQSTKKRRAASDAALNAMEAAVLLRSQCLRKGSRLDKDIGGVM
ncbi:MAG: hypothetical protein IT439_02325 [Phycisphaerales bacterium]|nr:hypothetical protein [Phycisphaerales bacterium]